MLKVFSFVPVFPGLRLTWFVGFVGIETDSAP